jgi:hypothetical protein
MLIAIMVLAALFLLALPFAVLMRLQHSASTQALHTSRARTGDAGALNQARAVLAQGDYQIEEDSPVFPFDDPDVDTLWEFHTTLRTTVSAGSSIPDSGGGTFDVENALGFPSDGNPDTLDGYIRVEDEWMAYCDVDIPGPTATFPGGEVTVPAAGRGLFGTAETDHAEDSIVSFFPDSELWHVEIRDPQGRINLNTAPYLVVLNLLGYLGIGEDGGPAPAPGDAGFPNERQQNLAAAISSYRLYYGNWNPDDSLPDESYTRFQNLSALKNIAAAPWFGAGGYTALTAEELDLLAPYVTLQSEASSGEIWLDDWTGLAIPINGGASARTESWAAQLTNAANVPVGSVLRIRDDTADEEVFRMVTSVNRAAAPLSLASAIGSGADIWIEVSGVSTLDAFRQVEMTTSPGTDPYTPGYLEIGGEWVEYSYVVPGGTQVYISDRGLFGTAPANHGADDPVEANVVGWRYVDPSTGDEYAPAVTAVFDPADTSVAIERRHALNINTITEPVVLASLLHGVSNSSGFFIEPDSAVDIAQALLAYTSDQTMPSGPPAAPSPPPYDFFNGDEQWFDPAASGWDHPPGLGDDSAADLEHFLNPGLVDAGFLSPDDADMLRGNFADSPDYWPEISTMPLRFNSGPLTSADVRSLAVVDDEAGTPIAESDVARAPLAAPGRKRWVWLSQQDFLTEMTGGGKHNWVTTHPLDHRLPPEDLLADDRYVTADPGIGSVGPRLLTTGPNSFTAVLEGLHEAAADFPDHAFDLDYSVAADTPADSAPAVSADNTTSQGITGAALKYPTRYYEPAGQRHIESDSFHATMQPLAVEFWLRPEGEPGAEQVLFDLGQGDWENDTNQLRIFLEPAPAPFDDTWRLVVHVRDEMGSTVQARNSVGVGGSGFVLAPGEWHHVAVALGGTFWDEMAIFIDGIYDRQMEWEHTYSAGQDTPIDVDEGYYWPVAMTVPLKKYQVSPGPDNPLPNPPPNYIWSAAAGHDEIGLRDISDLPERGWVAIDDTGTRYEYEGFGTVTVQGITYDTIKLVNPATLQETHEQDEPVTAMVPVVQPAVHDPASTTATIQAADNIAFRSYDNVANGAFDSDSATGSAAVDDVVDNPSAPTPTNFPAYYKWLVFDPQTPDDPVVSGAPNVLEMADRWKVYDDDDFVGSPVGVLAGCLPTGSLGASFAVGADRVGGSTYTGELDELRLTSLPMALLSAETDVYVEEWQWVSHGTTGALRAERRAGASGDLTFGAGSATLRPDGGYFLVGDDDTRQSWLFSYETYDQASGLVTGLEQVYDDLTPTGVADLPASIVGERLLRLLPLNFVTSSRLASAYGAAGTDIPLEDIGDFPENGFVKINDEVIGYWGKQAATQELERPDLGGAVPAFPRGAFGTTPGDHIAGDIVRLLPVRHPDHYRAEVNPGTWDEHQGYSVGQLTSQTSTIAFTVGEPSRLKRVWWRFREPLEDGQRVAVLVMVDDGGALDWNSLPEEDGDGNPETSTDLLWGYLEATDGAEWGQMAPLHNGVSPNVTSKVEVRFLFDLGGTSAYNTVGRLDSGGQPFGTFQVFPDAGDGWLNMVEVDEVGVEILTDPQTF